MFRKSRVFGRHSVRARQNHKRVFTLEMCEQRTLLSGEYFDVVNNSHADIPGSLIYEAAAAAQAGAGNTVVIDAGVGESIVLEQQLVLNDTNLTSADPGVVIYDGKAPAAAASIVLEGSGTITVSGVSIELGLDVASANLVVNAMADTFSNSSTSGAIDASAGGDIVNVTGCQFVKTAESNGNGIVADDATVNVSNSTFASDDDDAIVATGGDISISSSTFSGSLGNYAVKTSDATVTAILDNFGINPGGDISNNGGKLQVEYCNLNGNTSTAAGVSEIALTGGTNTLLGDLLNNGTQLGSVVDAALDGGSLTIDNTGVVGNTSGPNVLGTIVATGPTGTLTVTGSTIANNTAYEGPAIYVGAGVSASVGTTAILGNINKGGDGVGGVEAASGGLAVLSDAIVYGNTTMDVGPGVTGSYTNAATGTLSKLSDNVTANPDGVLDTTLDTYTLGANSKDIGAGQKGSNIGPDQQTGSGTGTGSGTTGTGTGTGTTGTGTGTTGTGTGTTGTGTGTTGTGTGTTGTGTTGTGTGASTPPPIFNFRARSLTFKWATGQPVKVIEKLGRGPVHPKVLRVVLALDGPMMVGQRGRSFAYVPKEEVVVLVNMNQKLVLSQLPELGQVESISPA